MNYLLSPSSNLIRDVYQRFINKSASDRLLVGLQKIFIVVIGIVAFFLALRLKSVLEMSYFAYTIYGVAITPSLIAALAWKRATKAGGLASIISGTIVCIGLKILSGVLPPEMVPEGDLLGFLSFPGIAGLPGNADHCQLVNQATTTGRT